VWIHSSSGQFSSKSCYKAFFLGSITFEPWKRLWKTWAPPKCKFFIWLAIRNKCWTADRLHKRGLDQTEVCPLCDQEPENIQHLLCTCVFARQFWYYILPSLGMANLSPDSNESTFADWWAKFSKQVHKSKRRGFNSIIILGAWCLWLHRNKVVFDGVSPSIIGIKAIFWMKLNSGGLPVLGILRLWFLVLEFLGQGFFWVISEEQVCVVCWHFLLFGLLLRAAVSRRIYGGCSFVRSRSWWFWVLCFAYFGIVL
jgi:hypothetical protein